MPKDKITPPKWYEVEEGQKVVFFEGKSRGVDLLSKRAWVNGVVFSAIAYLGLLIISLLLVWIRG